MTKTYPSSDQPKQPQLFRFGLRQLFFVVTLLSVFCALMATTEGGWPLLIGAGTLLVGAHVLGNLIGTRLRDASADVQAWRAKNPQLNADRPRVNTEPYEIEDLGLPPCTPLANRGSVVGQWRYWLVASGAILGAIVGGTLIPWAIGPHVSWPGWAAGTISCMVLGTWLAFLACSFSTIARHAWRHASEEGE